MENSRTFHGSSKDPPKVFKDTSKVARSVKVDIILVHYAYIGDMSK